MALTFGASGMLFSVGALLTAAVLAARAIRMRPALLDQVRAFNRRILNPRTLRRAGRRGAYVHALRHVGRRSGRVYTTPLEALPVAGGFAIPMTYGLRADWARNTLAAGEATLLREGEVIRLTRPRVAPLAELAPALPWSERLGLRALGVETLLLLERAEAPGASATAGARSANWRKLKQPQR